MRLNLSFCTYYQLLLLRQVVVVVVVTVVVVVVRYRVHLCEATRVLFGGVARAWYTHYDNTKSQKALSVRLERYVASRHRRDFGGAEVRVCRRGSTKRIIV